MPAGKRRKGVKKKVGSEKEQRGGECKEVPVEKVEKVEEEAKCSSPVELRRSRRKNATNQKDVKIESNELEESTGKTADPYDADSEHENVSVNDKSENENQQSQSAKIKDLKPTPLLSHFVSRNIHANDHSTPSDSSAPGTDDSFFGFDSLDKNHKKKFSFSPIVADTGLPLTPSTFSPMSTVSFAESTGSRPSFLKPKSPLKDHSVNKVKVPLSLGITQLPIEKPERKTKKKAAPKKKTKKDENAWVNEWEDMFKDVEGHNLLVE